MISQEIERKGNKLEIWTDPPESQEDKLFFKKLFFPGGRGQLGLGGKRWKTCFLSQPLLYHYYVHKLLRFKTDCLIEKRKISGILKVTTQVGITTPCLPSGCHLKF